MEMGANGGEGRVLWTSVKLWGRDNFIVNFNEKLIFRPVAFYL